MDAFDELLKKDWLEAFVKYASYGEASPRLMKWVGVSTVAAALQRKVWFDQEDYQWSPNFYILIVGEQGAVRKSTSIDIGMRLLKGLEGVYIGPSAATWPAFVQLLGTEATTIHKMADGADFPMSCVTLPISEFGTFFKPQDNDQIDGLTDLWDGKLDTFKKVTKTNGTDEVINAWINIIAATTPKWVTRNLTDDLMGSGLVSRFICLHGEMPERDIAYPKRCMPPERAVQRQALRDKLQEIAKLSGAVTLTEAAYAWGETWYEKKRRALRATGFGSLEAGFLVREQVHLHKLAMVLAAARNLLPVLDVQELKDADVMLDDVAEDARKVFGVVGQTRISGAAREIVEAVTRAGANGIARRTLYRKQFFRVMSSNEFDEAVKSALQAELILESDGVACPILIARKL